MYVCILQRSTELTATRPPICVLTFEVATFGLPAAAFRAYRFSSQERTKPAMRVPAHVHVHGPDASHVRPTLALPNHQDQRGRMALSMVVVAACIAYAHSLESS
jgi:hypothetical protein